MAESKYYGQFGGQYVSESLMNTLAELEKAFDEAIRDPEFAKDYIYYLKEYVGRATPLYGLLLYRLQFFQLRMKMRS